MPHFIQQVAFPPLYMEDLLKDPVFYWLVWGIFTVSGVIIGWSLRAAYPEQELKRYLDRTEQERNTLARLYTHIKHQHDLREADFKRASLEASSLRNRLETLELEKQEKELADQNAHLRANQAEEYASQLLQKTGVLELQARHLQEKNNQLNLEISRQKQELEAWNRIYRDFQQMQGRLIEFERKGMQLESERNTLRQQLEAAQIQIENLQLSLVQQRHEAEQTVQPEKGTSAKGDRAGGPAAPELTDDLKIINGITPFAEQQLFALGILTYEQISRWDDEAIIAFARALQISPGKIYQEDWVGQARHLLRGSRIG